MDLMYQILPIIFIAHWFADFVFQTSWMAENKSSNLQALHCHVSAYSLILLLFLMNPFYTFWNEISFEKVIWFVLINGILHGIVDFFTSKISSFFWKTNQIHNFFVTVGFDQLLHQICLIYTTKMMFC